VSTLFAFYARRQYSLLYVAQEDAAKAAAAGIWQGTFQYPWDYRKNIDLEEPPNPDCPIKGNINSDGQKIYHVPGSTYYNTTGVNEGGGERWFCNTLEAEVAGWRPSGCTIKGDIDGVTGEKVYYPTSNTGYGSVVVTVLAGDKWFCSEREAQLAGWRPAGCAIKGDIMNSKRTYYVPGASLYVSVQVNVAAGERWFCTETQAVAAGWVKSSP
jgi:hypothetical protein